MLTSRLEGRQASTVTSAENSGKISTLAHYLACSMPAEWPGMLHCNNESELTFVILYE
jgi:hypothetical protein